MQINVELGDDSAKLAEVVFRWYERKECVRWSDVSSLCEKIGFNQLSEAIGTAYITGEFYRSMANGFRNNCFSEMVRMIVFPRKVVYPGLALFTLPHQYVYSFPLDSRRDFYCTIQSTSNVCVQNRKCPECFFKVHMSMHSP